MVVTTEFEAHSSGWMVPPLFRYRSLGTAACAPIRRGIGTARDRIRVRIKQDIAASTRSRGCGLWYDGMTRERDGMHAHRPIRRRGMPPETESRVRIKQDIALYVIAPVSVVAQLFTAAARFCFSVVNSLIVVVSIRKVGQSVFGCVPRQNHCIIRILYQSGILCVYRDIIESFVR